MPVGAPASKQRETSPEVITNAMLNSAVHEFFLLISFKMPTSVGILTFMSRKNSILC